MQELPDYFDGIIEILTTYIEHKTDHFTLQTYGGDYINGPYVQALQEHDNILLCGSGARRGGAVSGIGGHNAAAAVIEELLGR